MTNIDGLESRITPTIHVILACHNRSALTQRALTAVLDAAQHADVPMSVTVFDDGSNDGTSDAIRHMVPDAKIFSGDGSFFWAASMARAEQSVLAQGGLLPSDVILWLNDDVVVDQSSVARAIGSWREHPGAVLVGAMRDPASGRLTYSAMKRAGLHPLRFQMIEPKDVALPADAFNGNFVLVPVHTARIVGGIDGSYSHALADIDYGVRCGRSGVQVLLMEGTFGSCARNPDPKIEPILAEWKRFRGAKGGGNFSSLMRYLKKNGTRAWPFWLAATYLMWWIRAIERHQRVLFGVRRDK
ncbi:glycosyltransferase family 2 protein [Microbacterium testaceum]|uniref:glycosyltransferase family 2 protein n=1 Tax=Microbacterium testaceum TaxID=2033 RepID=UPI000ACD29B1|nr:glycosyltransferase [Microbacterium testaceum]